MKKFKNLIIAAVVITSITTIIACGKKEKETTVSNFKIEYKATVEVQEVICNVLDQELKLTPMHDDKKVKKAYSNTTELPKEKDIKVSLKIIDDNKIIYENTNLNVDLSGEKKANISIVGDNLKYLKVDLNNK